MTTQEVLVTFVEEIDFTVKKRTTISEFKVHDLYDISIFKNSNILILKYKGESVVLKNRF